MSPTYLACLRVHLIYTCLPLVSLLSQDTLGLVSQAALGPLGRVSFLCLLWIHLAGCFYTCLHLSPCVSSCLYALGRMILHMSPCLSPFLLHLSALVSHSGYASPDVFTLVSACLFACSMPRHSWPNDFTLVSHLSPCLSPFLLHLSPLVPLLVYLVASLVSLLVSLLV